MEQIENFMTIEERRPRKIFAYCEQCEEPIFDGQECIYDECSNVYMHEECKDEYIEDFIESNLKKINAEGER